MFRISVTAPDSSAALLEQLLDAHLIPFEIDVPQEGRASEPGWCNSVRYRAILYALGPDERDQRLEFVGRLPGVGVEVSLCDYGPEDWATRWMDGFRWCRIDEDLAVGPPFKPCPFPVACPVVIDPGQAFGTGRHESTRLAMGLLANVVREHQGLTLCDVGTGSGVLAITARKLGAGRTVGLDIDPVSCQEARRNAGRNGVEFLVLAGTPEAVAGEFDLVVANMLGFRLLACREALKRLVATSGRLVLSGLADDDRDGFEIAMFGLHSAFDREIRVSDGEWWAGCWRKVRS